MARYDQGGGCACGLQRVCDCASRTQADGRKTVKMKDGTYAIDRSDPEGGIPGRAPSPQARGRARRNKHEAERTARRMAELDEQSRIVRAVDGLSPKAKKVWERMKKGCWYPDPTPAILELQDAGLLVFGGRVAVVRCCYMPIGSKPYVLESVPENLP